MDRPRSSLDAALVSGSTLARWGVRSWLLTGILVATAAVLLLLAQVSGFVVPLVIASVLGALFAPVVDRLQDRGVPRSGGALLVLLAVTLVVIGSAWLFVAGIVDQASEIGEQLAAGLAEVDRWLEARGVDLGTGTSLADQATSAAEQSAGGAASLVSGVFSSAVSLGIGAAMAAFLIYYVLADWHSLTRFVGRHLTLDEDTGAAVVGDAVVSVRRYFWSLTLSAVVTAVLIGGTAWVLDVPLAFTIAVITLVTSYVPYLGAIISGAFATIIALGSAGLGAAVIMLVVILVVQNVVQTIVLARLASAALSLHPIVVLGATIVGAALAGVLGASLAAPAVAVGVQVQRRLAGRGVAASEPSVDVAGDVAGAGAAQA
jgi:predicted PurR-regulated permease PerM